MNDREALARLLHSEGDGFAQFKNASPEDQDYYLRQAGYVLESTWLKVHDAEIAATALREAAAAWWHRADIPSVFDGWQWLRARAEKDDPR